MPRADIGFYQERENDVPALDWLIQLRRSDRAAYAACIAAVAAGRVRA
jgi:hypothetical protein